MGFSETNGIIRSESLKMTEYDRLKMSGFYLALVLLLSAVNADVYLHFPPGSNNRVNENTANRRNPKNAFDSQNNDKGGYNVPDATDVEAGGDARLQYFLKFFQSGNTGKSTLRFVWTNQHGCGGNEASNPAKLTCDLIFQYMCQDDDLDDNNLDQFRNGVETASQDFTGNKQTDVKTTRRLHESWDNYARCSTRERNKGLFTADQKLAQDSAIYTRQDRQGTRYGYECPEERDYWPYVSPWTDIAILTTNTSMCNYYQKESFNVKPRYDCIQIKNNVRVPSPSNNAANCSASGGQWLQLYSYLEKATTYKTKATCEQATTVRYKYIWAYPHDMMTVTEECLVLHPEVGPVCAQAQWSRSNYLGLNSEAEPLSYDWVLPSFPSKKIKRCVARLRYNISTSDYDPYNIDAASNNGKSPIQNKPKVNVTDGIELQINLNTDQVGRTFQDRTHLFKLLPRPDSVSDAENIVNWNMMGKRGNIVQTYPAIEYDFTPRNFLVNSNDLIHIQWTGSNTQAGDDGQGTPGTDRSNLVQIRNRDENYPYPFEQTTFWKNAEVRWSPMAQSVGLIKKEDLALYFASAGYYRCRSKANCAAGDDAYAFDGTKAKLNSLLNNAPASFDGALLKVAPGTYHMMCTRNNNFSNRAQKGTLTVI